MESLSCRVNSFRFAKIQDSTEIMRKVRAGQVQPVTP